MATRIDHYEAFKSIAPQVRTLREGKQPLIVKMTKGPNPTDGALVLSEN